MGLAKAYYNEIDPYCAEWLNNLILEGVIASGDVDTRSIEDVRPSDLAGYTQCHFFAGIGVWSHSLRLAGWPDDRKVWTGSCPCQPFSAAGKRGGTADERHLWPAWSWLIRQCKPRVVFGEQVASKDGRNWLDLVSTDLEAMGYAVGAGDICAAGVGAPHIRQRLYFVADAERGAAERYRLKLAGETGGVQSEARQRKRLRDDSRNGEFADELADAQRNAGESRGLAEQSAEGVGATGAGAHAESGRRGMSRELGHAEHQGLEGLARNEYDGGQPGRLGAEANRPVAAAGALDWLMADTDGGQSGDGDLQRGGQHGQQPQDSGPDWPPGSYGDESGHETGCKGDCGRHAICCGGSCCANPNKCDGNRCWLAHDETGRRGEVDPVAGRRDEGDGSQGSERLVGGDGASFWSACDWLPCIDGKARPVEPGTFPLVNGAPARVGRLRAYGNAIVAPCAKEFIAAYLDATEK